MLSKSPSYCLTLFSPAATVVLFSFFLHQNEWLALLILATCFVLLASWIWRASPAEIRRVFAVNSCRWFWILCGATLGVALAAVLRWNQTATLLPSPLRPFLLIAILVGLTEELLFRGYFLGQLLQWTNPAAAITLSSLLHAAYKVSLFVCSAGGDELLSLGSITFAAGLVLGYWRKASASIWPCIVFHALFDLWVYGDRVTPWWVW